MDKIASFTVKKRVAIQLFSGREECWDHGECQGGRRTSQEIIRQFYLQHPSGNIISQTLLESWKWWSVLSMSLRILLIKHPPNLRSSSISRTLASKLLQAFSFSWSSFILLFMLIVFRVIFFPGLLILRNHGSHWRKTLLTCQQLLWWDQMIKFLGNPTQVGITWVSAVLWW